MTADSELILVIEDEWSSRRFLTEALGDIARVRCVASASEAYNVLSELGEDISMVITDMIMRGQSGLDFLSYLRNDINRKDLPVIVYTAHGGEDMERLALESGATEFLTKPVSLPKLRLRVAALLSLTRALSRRGDAPVSQHYVMDLDVFRQVFKTEVRRAVNGGYCLLICRAHCDQFLAAKSTTSLARESALVDMAQRHYELFPSDFSHVWQEPSLSHGVLTMGLNVDAVLRQSRLYRAWLSERALLVSHSESDDHIGLGMLVCDFSAMDTNEREQLDVAALVSDVLAKVDASSRAAVESSSVLVTVVQDVMTI